MAEGQAEASPGAGADGAGLLLAVEQVGADVAALTRLLAAQPAEVAARVDIDAATAGIVMRLGTLGSALDQLRLSLLAGLDRAAERVDQPSWLPELLADLAGLGNRVEAAGAQTGEDPRLNDLTARLDQPTWLPELRATLGQLGARPAPEDGLASPLNDLATRIEQVVADAAEGTRLQLAALTTVPGVPPGEAAEQVDEASGRIASRISAMGNTLDQLRISLLSELDRVGERLDRPAWLPELQSATGDEVAALPLQDDLGSVLGELQSRVTRVLDDPRLDEVATAVADLSERVAPLPDRLKAIAVLVDRLTPLARAGDEAGSIVGLLDRVSTTLDQIVARLPSSPEPGTGLVPMVRGDGDEPSGGVADLLADVSRRQDEVTTAVSSVLDQVRGPTGVDAVLDRMEQRERSLAARLDRIDSELRRRPDGESGARAEPGLVAAQALDAASGAHDAAGDAAAGPGAPGGNLEQLRISLLEGLDRVAVRLDQPAWLPELQAALRDVAADRSPEDDDVAVPGANLARPLDDPRLDDVATAMAELAERVAPLPKRLAAIAVQVDRLTPLARTGDEAGSLFGQLDRLNTALDQIVAHFADTGAAAAEAQPVTEDRDERSGAIVDLLAGVTRGQGEVAESVGMILDQMRGPMVIDTVMDRMEQRERSLAARLDRIDAQLRRDIEEAPAPAGDAEATIRLGELASAVAAIDPGARLTRLEETLGDLAESSRADLAALNRLLAAQPDEVGSYVAAAAGAAAARTGALGGNLEQLRTSLLEGLDRVADRLDQPAWLPQLQTVIDDAAAARARQDDGPVPDGDGEPVEDDPRLDRVATAVAELAERVAPLPERLTAIAVQVDRLTPLARAGDEAGSVLGQLDRVSATLDQIVAHLPSPVEPETSLTAGRQAAERAEALAQVMAGLARRQDEVAAAVSSVLDQMSGPMGTNTVLDRLEQRESSLVARLDRIDSELRRRTEVPVDASPRSDLDAARVLRVVLEAVERQERTVSAQLDHLDADVRTIAAGPASATVVPWAEPTALETVLDGLDEQQRAVARQLGWVGDRLAEVATQLIPTDSPPAEAGWSRAVDEVVAHLDRREQALSMRLDRMEVELRRSIAARPAEPRSEESGELRAAVDRLSAMVESTAQRLDRRLSSIDVARRAPPPSTSADVASVRLAELRAERALVQDRLREERVLASRADRDEEADAEAFDAHLYSAYNAYETDVTDVNDVNDVNDADP